MKVHIFKYLSVFGFCVCVLLLFRFLNRLHPYHYIDEAFHIPQVLRYCAGNFTQWDPKITTLPGLYIITSLVLSPLNQCSITFIRFINVLATYANLYLAYEIMKKSMTTHGQKWNDYVALTVAYNIALFPPLFFFFFLYYTDVISMSAVLLMLLLHLHEKFKLAAIAGLLSTFMRQTNIVWLGFLTVERALDILESEVLKQKCKPEHNSVHQLGVLYIKLKQEFFRGPLSFLKFTLYIFTGLTPYLLVCSLFIIFVMYNKGVVVGDRAAHKPTIHIPQLFYFSVFTFCFSWPYTIVHWRKYLNFVQKNIIPAAAAFLVFAVIVHYNTEVHPYLLADNRHYTFYIWRLMQKYTMMRYLLVFLYSFSMYTIWCCFNHLRLLTQINYLLIVSVVLIPQLLLEPRYFIVPFIIYRLNIVKPKLWQIIAECFTVFIVNCLQFFVFSSKVFYWEDQPGPQRISW